jgi:hypothetical protein
MISFSIPGTVDSVIFIACRSRRNSWIRALGYGICGMMENFTTAQTPLEGLSHCHFQARL